MKTLATEGMNQAMTDKMRDWLVTLSDKDAAAAGITGKEDL